MSLADRFFSDGDDFTVSAPKTDADWNEEDHPRDPSGASSGGDERVPAPPSRRTFTDTPPAGSSGDTMKDHYKDGKPSEDRKATVHDPIVHAALDHVEKAPEGAKVAYFTMGPPGSGKSAGLRNIDQAKFVRVDPDAIKEQLPEFKAAISDRDNTFRGAAAMVHEEASDISKRVMREALEQGKHILVDGTGVKPESITRKMDQAKAAGYHVHLAYSHLGDEKEGQRRARAEKTGRTVPKEFVHQAYEAVPKNFAEVAKHADTFEVHDSSKPDSPTVWSKSPEGEQLADPAFVRGFKEKYHADAGDFDESKHPRAANGQFGEGGGESSASGTAPRASSPKEFKDAFDRAFKDDPHSGFVSHYSEAELAGMKTFLSHDGKTGVALHDHGDGRIEATALFNKGGPPGAGTAMMKTAIDHGANYCECFGDTLRAKYEGVGFHVESKSAFDPQYAPKDWNEAKFGTPPYYTLRIGKKDGGDWDESKHPRGAGGKFGEGGGGSDTPKGSTAKVEPLKLANVTATVNAVMKPEMAIAGVQKACAADPGLKAWMDKPENQPAITLVGAQIPGTPEGVEGEWNPMVSPLAPDAPAEFRSNRIDLCTDVEEPKGAVVPADWARNLGGKTWNVSAIERSKEAKVQSNLVHELGHHVSLSGTPEEQASCRSIMSRSYDDVLEKAQADETEKEHSERVWENTRNFQNYTPKDMILRGDVDTPTVSRYAMSNSHEYFAECFATYYAKGPTLLRAKDPIGFKMVEAVLKVRGIH